MRVELWERAEEIFHGALDRSPEDRDLYVRQECNGEVSLLSEVSSLLRSFEEDSAFLEEPVFEFGLTALGEKPRKDLTGCTFGFYQLEERIGAGGMGEVYKAVDIRLNRPVALKFLTDSLENNTEAKRRLVREAQAVAMLDHPNICAVHSIEELDAAHFIVMQYVEGQTLADFIAERRVDLEEFKSVARQIGSAVAYAHSHGVIHRDLKPGNIMLTTDGQIKVLDFGLAKILPQHQLLGGDAMGEVSRFSQNGSIIGTVAYMSPEQLRGEKLDCRSDIFSIGIILYELLTGGNPFKRECQADVIAAILAGDAPRLDAPAAGFPDAVGNVIATCLRRNINERYQSAAEILMALDSGVAVAGGRASRKWWRIVWTPVLAAALLLIVWLAAFLGPNQLIQVSPRSLAVLPISCDQAENEFLASGLTQSFIENLSNLSGLHVKNEFQMEKFKGPIVDPQAAGRELNVDAVFTARIITRGDSTILTGRVVRVSDGSVIDYYERRIDATNLIEVQEDLSAGIAGTMKAQLTGDDQKQLAKKDTEVPEAKLLFLRGRHFLERQQDGDLQLAEQSFTQATDLDPLYLKAWTGLADTYCLISVPGHKGSIPPEEASRRAKVAVQKALEIDNTVAEPYVSLAMSKLRYDWDWYGAEAAFREAIRRNANLPSARLGLSNLLIVRGRFSESVAEARIAKQLAPFSPIPDLSIARTYSFERNWTEMNKVLSDSLAQFPGHKRLTYFRGLLYLRTGRFDDAIQIFEKMYTEDKLYAAAPLAWAYGKSGRKDKARGILKSLEAIAQEKYVSSQEWAWIYLALGERDTAVEYFRRACDEKFSPFPFALRDPAIDELRDDPRFPALERCARLPAS